MKGVAWFGLKNATDLWQVVDAGIGQLLKVFVSQAHRNWLDKEENANKWYGNDSNFTASERRFLITHWAGVAWKELCSPEYEKFRRTCWEKTGCLMTVDESEDEKVAPEGLPSCKIPPLIEYLPPSNELPVPNQDEGNEPGEINEEEVELEPDGKEIPDDMGDEWEDHEDDRVFSAPYCGRKMKVLYENGWQTGNMNYYNDHIQKYHVIYSDNSEDYIGEDEIDMVEIRVV